VRRRAGRLDARESETMAIRGLPSRGRRARPLARRGLAGPRTPAARRAVLGTALCSLALGLSGCGGFFNMPDRLAETQAQVTDVQRRQEALAREVEALKAQLAAQEEILRQMRADQSSNTAEVKSSIELLRGQLDFTSRQLLRPDTRPAAPASADSTARRAAKPDSASAPALEEQGLYNAAREHLQQGRYPLAINGFREYLSKFPAGALGDAAQYGIAEAYYAQSDFPTAAIEYRALVDRYPGSDRVPAALLKAGLSYFEAGKEDLGRAYLERVMNEYPYSDEAVRAKDRLERWNKD
jgi:tol-pal system protein YbgF